MRSLYLNASRVADAIGVSRFVSREQLFTECQRYSCEGSRPPPEHAEYILSDHLRARTVRDGGVMITIESEMPRGSCRDTSFNPTLSM